MLIATSRKPATGPRSSPQINCSPKLVSPRGREPFLQAFDGRHVFIFEKEIHTPLTPIHTR